MNVKDHEEQENMEISWKAGGWHSLQHLSYIAENIEPYKKGNKVYNYITFNTWKIIIYIYISEMCTSADKDLGHYFNCFKCWTFRDMILFM